MFNTQPEENVIEGLTIVPNFITEDEEIELINVINQQVWNKSLKRLTQHYGYGYNYKSRSITKSDRIGDVPDWLNNVVQRMLDNKFIDEVPDQVIINRYLPGEGISAHVDAPRIFHDKIYSISLGSPAKINFSRGMLKTKLYLKPRTFLLMQGVARYKYKHSILPKMYDLVDGVRVHRTTRYSITFRNVILSN